VQSRRTYAEVLQRRIRTGPLPKLPEYALAGPDTLESRALPSLFIGAFATLVLIQIFLAF
jgi:hypothetical protein